jgi:hypothetical protein
MSFKGNIEARCPQGCEPFETEVWSFIRGDQSPDLRDAVLWRECNLLLCPHCGAAFHPEASYIYFEPEAGLLAFVFPESYREKADYWRGKMREDFLVMKDKLAGELAHIAEPEIFFGTEELAELLEREDFRGEEREVMEAVAAELGLELYRVEPGFARRQGVPRSLPYTGAVATRDGVKAGLVKLLAANDRLAEYRAFLDKLSEGGGEGLPPAAETPKKKHSGSRKA